MKWYDVLQRKKTFYTEVVANAMVVDGNLTGGEVKDGFWWDGLVGLTERFDSAIHFVNG